MSEPRRPPGDQWFGARKFRRQLRIDRLGRAYAQARQRVLDDIYECEKAAMSPFALRTTPRHVREQETEL